MPVPCAFALEAFGLGVVTSGGCHVPARNVERGRSDSQLLVGYSALNPEVVKLLAIEAAAVHLERAGAVGRMEGSIDLDLRVEFSRHAESAVPMAGIEIRLHIRNVYVGTFSVSMDEEFPLNSGAASGEAFSVPLSAILASPWTSSACSTEISEGE